jgi:hypothetical protein
LGNAASQDEEVKRLSVPDSGSQNKARRLVRDLFKGDYAKTKPVDQISLAKNLIQQALGINDDPATQFVMLSDARDLSIRAGNLRTALDANSLLVSRFNIDLLVITKEILMRIGEPPRTEVEALELAVAYLDLSESARLLSDYKTAIDLVDRAGNWARQAKTVTVVLRVGKKKAELQKGRQRLDAFHSAKKMLVKDPENPQANHAIGTYHCFEKRDWDGGLPYLAKGGNASLCEIARFDLSLPRVPEDQVKLGDRWSELADSKSGEHLDLFRERACYWYRLALPSLTEGKRGAVLSRLRELVGGEDLLQREWNSDNEVSQTKEGLLFDGTGLPRNSPMRAWPNRIFSRGEYGSYIVSYRVHEIDPNKGSCIMLSLCVADDGTAGVNPTSAGSTITGVQETDFCLQINDSDGFKNQVLSCRDLETKWQMRGCKTLSTPVQRDQDYSIRLTLTQTGFRLNLYNANEELLSSIENKVGIPSRFQLRLSLSSGKVLVTRVAVAD